MQGLTTLRNAVDWAEEERANQVTAGGEGGTDDLEEEETEVEVEVEDGKDESGL